MSIVANNHVEYYNGFCKMCIIVKIITRIKIMKINISSIMYIYINSWMKKYCRLISDKIENLNKNLNKKMRQSSVDKKDDDTIQFKISY